MKKYVFGIDIGGTAIKLGLFEVEGNLLEKWEIPTRTADGGIHVLPDAAEAVKKALERHRIPENHLVGIGIGVPGPVDESGIVHRCVNLGWGKFDIIKHVNHFLPGILNVKAGNDATIATLGELWKGAGKGCNSAAMLTLGTGIGGGIVTGGKIFTGAHGAAGEWGHMIVDKKETSMCNCGKYGCLEQYSSANGIVRLGRQILKENKEPSELRSINNFTSKDICDLARKGDKLALQILETCCDYLGRAMSYIAAAIDPEVFLIGGGMSKAGDILIHNIQKSYQKYAFHITKDTPVKATLLGNDAGIYGCAKMILSSYTKI